MQIYSNGLLKMTHFEFCMNVDTTFFTKMHEVTLKNATRRLCFQTYNNKLCNSLFFYIWVIQYIWTDLRQKVVFWVFRYS